MYSARFESALNLAGLRHADQVRKGTGAPYIIHLVHVAAILAKAGYDEDTQIVGLLHDILEDTTKGVREADEVAEHIGTVYGTTIAAAVRTLSEPKRFPDGTKVPWRARKEAYLSQLKMGSPMALRVSAADKLHNLCTLAEELADSGPRVWDRFTAGPDETFWFYRAVYRLLQDQSDGPVVDALGRQLKTMDVID